MLIFLDLETTGIEKEDKICSLAIVYMENNHVNFKYELINEGKKITPKASSVNHITKEMIVDSPSVKKSDIFTFLVQNNTLETTLVGHNIIHDIQKLSESGFEFKGGIIDTKRVSKHLIAECENYSLQFLRYELKLYKQEQDLVQELNVNETLFAHHALSDAMVVYLLYLYLLEMVSDDTMLELSFKNVRIEKFEFGKYKGRYIEEIYENDRNYLQWMISNMDLDDDLRYSIDYYLEG